MYDQLCIVLELADSDGLIGVTRKKARASTAKLKAYQVSM